MNTAKTQVTIEDIDNLLRLHGTMIKREIDAGACQTRLDWDRMHKAQEAYYDAYEALVAKLPEF